MSDKLCDRHFELQYGRHDETLIITILGSKCREALKFGTQVKFNVLISTV